MHESTHYIRDESTSSRERERERRSDGAPRTAKYQAALEGY